LRQQPANCEILKSKLNCHSKQELIDFAISNGFIDALPFKDSAANIILKLEE
jgi:hypothetical protein